MLPKHWPPWLPYVAPFALFLLLSGLEGRFQDQYPLLYTVKIILVGGLLLALRGCFPEARPGGKGLVAASGLGLLLFYVWVLIDPHTPHFKWLGTRIGYDPFREIANDAARTAFLGVRFFGLVVIVPFVEELFYRSFLLRFVSDLDDFRRVPTGQWTWAALAVNVVLFGLSHPEWLVAAVFALAMCLLLRRTKNLFACIFAHAITNGLLGVFVLHFHAWWLW